MGFNGRNLKVAVVGHVEWVQFARVGNVPGAGEVVHAHDSFEEPAGGGAVAAVQLARLNGEATLFTALGNDDHGRQSARRLAQLGVKVRGAERSRAPTRRAITLVDKHDERTIITFGERLEPLAADSQLPWAQLGEMDAVFFTAGDVGALRAARAARVLVASPRAYGALAHGIPLDALVLSANDELERREAAKVGEDAGLVVLTDGDRGGSYRGPEGSTGRWSAADPPGPPRDSYGCGDSFAAGLTFALGLGLGLDDALVLAADCGAACLTGRGPYEGQLTASELSLRTR